MHLRFLFVCLCAAAIQAQTVISVQNAAAGVAGLPVNAFAPGSMVAVSIVRGGPVIINLPPSDYAVKVRPASGGELDAPVLQVAVGSVWALIPAGTPLGAADIVLFQRAEASSPLAVRIARSAVGLFTKTGSGIGPAVAQNDSAADPPVLNQLIRPAVPGDYLVLWGTGLGQAEAAEVTVEVGGIAVPPSYAGPTPGYPGLDQINAPLPAEAPDGCYVSVRVRTPESVSNEASIAKAAAAGACDHPFGLGQAALEALDAGEAVRLGEITLRSDITPASTGGLATTYTRNESAVAMLTLRDPQAVWLFAQPLRADPAYFRCELQNPVTLPVFVNADGADAGPQLTLQGPGQTYELPQDSFASVIYQKIFPAPDAVADPGSLPPSAFPLGSWNLSGPGGGTFAAFSASLQLPPPIRWTNRGGIATVDRANDLRVTWAANGYGADDVMTVTLSNGYFPQAIPAGTMATQVLCRAPAAAGTLTIPASLMGQIARSPVAGTLELRLAPRPDRRSGFDLPLAAGGAERGLFDYTFSEALRVPVR